MPCIGPAQNVGGGRKAIGSSQGRSFIIYTACLDLVALSVNCLDFSFAWQFEYLYMGKKTRGNILLFVLCLLIN